MNQKNSLYFLFLLGMFISACNAESNEKTEEESDRMIENIQKSDKEKADSVLRYWQDKTSNKTN